MLFVPLFLLERAPDPVPAGDGPAVVPAAASDELDELDAVTNGRGPAPALEPAAREDPGPVDGLEATSPVAAGQPAASAAAVPPPAPP
ncbi:MAG TPA: hypothetical protein VHH09_02725, partial [Acidimicrobiales bacterium]|nr:hypothetical protein [Acidimicrobiales bacterium]